MLLCSCWPFPNVFPRELRLGFHCTVVRFITKVMRDGMPVFPSLWRVCIENLQSVLHLNKQKCIGRSPGAPVHQDTSMSCMWQMTITKPWSMYSMQISFAFWKGVHGLNMSSIQLALFLSTSKACVIQIHVHALERSPFSESACIWIAHVEDQVSALWIIRKYG